MSKLRVELNSAGVRELLRSPELRALVEKHARAARPVSYTHLTLPTN